MPAYDMTHCWHLFVVRVDIERMSMTRDKFMQALKDKKIGTGLHFRATHTQKYYLEKYADSRILLPNTDWNSERICSLPLFPDMTVDDVQRVISAIKDVISGS
jgi:UDP-4-amino-4-deoxy-L-arabinose-oxoglutarate aminotransferase